MLNLVIDCPDCGKKNNKNVKPVVIEDDVCKSSNECNGKKKDNSVCAHWKRKTTKINIKKLWKETISNIGSKPYGESLPILIECIKRDAKGTLSLQVMEMVLRKNELSSLIVSELLKSSQCVSPFLKAIEKIKTTKNKNDIQIRKTINDFINFLVEEFQLKYKDMRRDECLTASYFIANLNLSFSYKKLIKEYNSFPDERRIGFIEDIKKKAYFFPHLLFAVTGEELINITNNIIESKDGDSENKERILGKLSIIKVMLDIMMSESVEHAVIIRIKDFIFNSGVRDEGKIGDIVAFDALLYEIADGNPLPGDKVELVESCWKYNDLVIRKGKIKEVKQNA